MAHITADRVKDTTTTTGTGNITLANSAPTGFRTLDAVAATSDTFFYALEGGSEWEVGLGTYSGSHVFVRTTVLASSNSGSAVNFSAGTKNFFITLPASKIADNTAYASSWDGETAVAPSKNAVYDKFEGLLHPGYVAANWYVISGPIGAVTGTSGTGFLANTVYYSPFVVTRRLTISDLSVRITTASSSNLCALAIYANNASTGRPTGTPLAATGDISTTSTGNVSADITGANVTLEPGIYWSAYWQNNAVSIPMIHTFSEISSLAAIVGSATLNNLISAAAQICPAISSAETFNSSAWPDASGETFTEITTLSRHVVMAAKAA